MELESNGVDGVGASSIPREQAESHATSAVESVRCQSSGSTGMTARSVYDDEDCSIIEARLRFRQRLSSMRTFVLFVPRAVCVVPVMTRSSMNNAKGRRGRTGPDRRLALGWRLELLSDFKLQRITVLGLRMMPTPRRATCAALSRLSRTRGRQTSRTPAPRAARTVPSPAWLT